MSKRGYLWRCLARALLPAAYRCPNCGGRASAVVDRKYLLTQLRRCGVCRLQYRVPTDRPGSNARYYEAEYDWGFTTTMPDEARLARLVRDDFAGSERDYAARIGLLRRFGLPESGRWLFDYGCSWGYGSYQLMRAGFDVTAFEIAPTRRRFARDKLGVNTVDDMDATVADPAHQGRYDCVFACHVVEHVPRPTRLFRHAWALLSPGGLFVSLTPNGAAACRRVHPRWSQLWGEVHPAFIDDVFLDTQFAGVPRVLASHAVKGSADLPATGERRDLDDLDGDELIFVARKSGVPRFAAASAALAAVA